MLLAILGAGFLFDRQQATDIRRQVDASAATVDDVVDAPPGIWLVELAPDGTRTTTGTPPAVRDAAVAALRVAGTNPEATAPEATVSDAATPNGAAPHRPFTITVEADGRDWPAAGVQREGHTFAAVYDIRLHATQERSLLTAMGVAGVLGVALSALTGWLAGRRAVRPLADALDLQRQFIADASHELRTPLSVISIRAQMLRRHLRAQGRGDLLPEVDQLVDDTKVMSDVVSDLLLSAQLDAGEATREPVNLVHVAEQVGRSLEPYAAEAGVRLSWPESAARRPVVVDGVSSSLRRAVLALVDNAVAHSTSGSSVEVLVSADEEARSAHVDVVDHGAGVDPEDLEVLTRRFARAKADEGAGRRFGLGLALVTQIVRSHGGALEVVETAGGGATFRLVLPLASVDDADLD
ncbi:sensor histidine kinase [Intrasporangium flavum]|uniref:sensor histidine kinase n=1 Tax=Intrasporangium flavum TaxID=1428657 RepID=UPI001F601C3C|nr:HAMP domain-containing sensor histidine kinase [Intrasporangium flavum]